MASSMLAAARGGGTKSIDAVAPVFFIASATFPNTGRSRCVLPAFLGLVPPTIWVQRERQRLVDRVGLRALPIVNGLLAVKCSEED